MYDKEKSPNLDLKSTFDTLVFPLNQTMFSLLIM